MNEEHLSPDGLYKIVVGFNEMRMSHWVQTPSLYHVQTNKILFDAPSLWSADSVKWSPDSDFVHMNMRLYPGSKPGIELRLYPASNEAKVQVEQYADPTKLGEAITGSFSEILKFLNRY